jgi:molecular chaperone HscC
MLIGIDLGTTNSLAAVFRNGGTELVPNALGHTLTPSAVSFGDDDVLMIGMAARERLSTHPHQTATAFKRWMGTDRRLRLGRRELRPEELSALVLKSLKNDAESWLGEPVHEAVITVPAFFNQAQRQATKLAGELAGFKVERLLNEPTAAGLAYGMQERANHSTFLIVDLGGGTFDVSVLQYFEGVVEVRASAGDTRLGGEDFVSVLERLFMQRCGIGKNDEAAALSDSGALWRAAEQAKRELSDQHSTVMRLVCGGRELEQTIRRDEFEHASGELLQRLRRPIERALMDARLDTGELAEVVLVGGATRMPIVRQTIARLFQRLPLRTINPDETIARGAAIQAALKSRDNAVEEIVLTDVMPYSLGVIVSEEVNGTHVGDRFSPIIERNNAVPISRMGNYCTLSDNQRILKLDIRQGESPIGSENLHLGDLTIDLPSMPAGHASVDVRFSYDANGLLAVDARETSTGKTVSKLILQSGALDETQVRESLARLEVLKVHPRDAQKPRYLLERAKRLYEERLGDDRAVIQHWISQFELALDTQDIRLVEQACEKFGAALDSIDHGFVY